MVSSIPNINNFLTYLTYRQIQPFWIRISLRVMAMKWEGTSHFLELKNWSLTARCSLVLYPRYFNFVSQAEMVISIGLESNLKKHLD